jgi:hypothetical protein
MDRRQYFLKTCTSVIREDMENGGGIFVAAFVVHLSTQLHGITTPKRAIFRPTVMKTSNLTY